MGKQPCAATLPSSCAYSSLADRAASSTKTTIAFLNQSLSRNSSRLCCIGFDGGKPNYSPMHSLGRLVPVSRQGLQTQSTWTKNRLLGRVRQKPVLDCRCDSSDNLLCRWLTALSNSLRGFLTAEKVKLSVPDLSILPGNAAELNRKLPLEGKQQFLSEKSRQSVHGRSHPSIRRRDPHVCCISLVLQS